jgi:hypothetical protein
MAGRGPAPKTARQRRGEPARGEWIDLPALEAPVLPELPAGEWSERTKDAWEAWRSDPVTGQYGPAEIDAALVLLDLYEEFVTNHSTKLAGEIRQWQDRLGLNPKGKRDLRWRVQEDALVVDMPAPKKARRLRAVE